MGEEDTKEVRKRVVDTILAESVAGFEGSAALEGQELSAVETAWSIQKSKAGTYLGLDDHIEEAIRTGVFCPLAYARLVYTLNFFSQLYYRKADSPLDDYSFDVAMKALEQIEKQTGWRHEATLTDKVGY